MKIFLGHLRLAFVVGIAGFLFVGASARAEAWAVKPEASPVTFVAIGKPGFLKIRGEGAQLNGTATINGEKLTGDFKVSLAALTTGIDLRDEHMKNKYLDVAKFPEAALVLDPVTISTGDNEYPFTGTLTIKGESKAIAGTLSLDLTAASASGSAEFKIKIGDYPAIGVPSHMGVTVAESVEIVAKFEAAKKP